jgi:hypothetical protein
MSKKTRNLLTRRNGIRAKVKQNCNKKITGVRIQAGISLGIVFENVAMNEDDVAMNDDGRFNAAEKKEYQRQKKQDKRKLAKGKFNKPGFVVLMTAKPQESKLPAKPTNRMTTRMSAQQD